MSENEWLAAFERGVAEARVTTAEDRVPLRARIERREPVTRESVVGDLVLWYYVIKHPYLDKRTSQGITELHLQMDTEIAYRLGEHVGKRVLE